MSATILLVEDEANLRLILRNNLKFVGYTVLEAADGEAAVETILARKPDLVILDIMLPKQDGLSVLREVRGQGFSAPVIFLTARGEEHDRIAGFEIGADDYVVKPFSVGELLGRVKAILRRLGQAPQSRARRFGSLCFDLDHYQVEARGRSIKLKFFEAEILKILLDRAGEAVSRAEILTAIWGDAAVTDRVIDNHVLNLRKKLEADPSAPQLLLTVHRVGYRFVPPSDNF